MKQIVERRLTDLLSFIVDNRGRTCPTAESGMPLIATNCVKDDELHPVFENIRFVDEATYSTWFRAHPIPGDVIFVCKGSPGRTALVPDPVPFCIAQDMVALRADPTVVDNRYLYYVLKSKETRRKIENMHVGTMIPHFKKGDFHRLVLPVHSDLGEQQAIAEVLSALDDKIAANTKIASTADEWVRAEYERIAYLSDEKCVVADLVSHRRNAANPELFEVHVPYVGLEHIPRRSMWLDKHGSSGEVSSNKSHFQRGDILFGKLRPYFHKVVTAPNSGICSTDVLVLSSNDEALSGYALASLAHDTVVKAVTAASQGTRMPRTNWKDLSNVEVPWPGHVAAAAFSTKVQITCEYVIGVLAENQTLAATRDALLPQLMSGKIRVEEAEEIASAAI